MRVQGSRRGELLLRTEIQLVKVFRLHTIVMRAWFVPLLCTWLPQLDAATVGEEQKTLMLERFQAEHPGFDFSGAEFSGSAPDPRTFMGGVHKR